MNITELTGSYRGKLVIKAYNQWLKKGDKVLDIGCGTGIITKVLADHLGVKITVCDVRNYLIYKDIRFVKITREKLPFLSESFDAALLNDVLHHLPQEKQEDLISQSIKVAKKVLIFEAKPTIFGKIADIILNKLHYGDLNVPLSFRTMDEWQALFKKLSLKFKTKTFKRPFWYPFSHIAFELQKG